MSIKTIAQPQKKTNYHHGNLREGLINTAAYLLETQSVGDISLRKIAKELGVSQTAVYAHFSDKTDLLAGVAENGFQRLTEVMQDRLKDIRDPYARVEAFAVNYMHFAFSNRALFQLMYSREVQDIESHKTLELSAGKLYALFFAAWTRFQPKGVQNAPYIWSMIHGQTLLMCDPKFGPALTGGKSPEDIARGSIAVFVEG